MNPRCEQCGCTCQACQGRQEAAITGTSGDGGAKLKKMMINNNNPEDRGRFKMVYAKFKEPAGAGGAKPKVGTKDKMIYAKFKEGSSSSTSSNDGTITGLPSRPFSAPAAQILPQVSSSQESSPESATEILPQACSSQESNQLPVQPSSVGNEDEIEEINQIGAVQEHLLEPQLDIDNEGGEGGGDRAAMEGNIQEAEMEQKSEGKAPADLPLADVREELEENSDSYSNVDSVCFVPPWERPLTGEERRRELLETRAKVLEWLEGYEVTADVEEVDEAEAPAVPEVSGQPGPLEKPEEEEIGKELIPMLKKSTLLERNEKDARRTQDDVLIPRAGDKLPEVQGKRVELMSNVEYVTQLNPHHLAVSICALLNSGGGHIIIGADSDQIIQGTRISRGERDSTRQMLDIINRENIEPSVHPTYTDIEFMPVAGLRDDERMIKITVRHVLTNILYRVKRMDGKGFKNGVYIRTSEGANKHVKM